MIEKRIKVTVPKGLSASDLLLFVQTNLKEYTDKGWKIGGVLQSNSLTKTVILFTNTETLLKNLNGGYYPESTFQQEGDLLYSLRHNKKDDGSYDYSCGQPVMVNDFMIRVQKSHGSEIPEDHLKALTEHLCKEANNWLFQKYGFQPE